MTPPPPDCPAGHPSVATDYCDTCGVAMEPVEVAGPLPTTEPLAAPLSGACPSCATTNPTAALFCENCGYDFTTGSMPRPPDPPPSPPPPPPPSENTSPAPNEAWVAEIWIDPDWYADQESTDPLPSPGVPDVVRLRNTSVLIGRASRSRGISPDLDLGSDSGISRRHAQLTTDGSRWFVEDLGSSNGTYVGGALGVLPKTPVVVGQRVEVGGDDRIYLGAWTRIVLRRAAPGEA